MTEIMMKSERFRKFIDIYDDRDIDEMAEMEMQEIEKMAGLSRSEISDLILNNDISMIDKDNYAQIFETLHNFAFDNFEELVAKLNENLPGAYDIKKLKDNLTLQEIFSKTCICEEYKCDYINDAIEMYHPYCMEMIIKRGISYEMYDRSTGSTYDAGIVDRIKEIIDQYVLDEKFFLSLEWLLAKGHLDGYEKYIPLDLQGRSKDILLVMQYRTKHDSINKVIKLLFKYGAKPKSRYSLLWIIERYDLEVIKMFIKEGLPIRNSLDYVINDRRTEDEIIEIMKYLLERGALIDGEMATALNFGYFKVIDFLIEAGDKPTDLSTYGTKSPDGPKYSGFVKLLNMGFQPHEYNLRDAIEKKKSKLCMLLLDHKVNFDSDLYMLALQNNLKDVCARMIELSSEKNRIIIAIRTGDNKYAINFFKRIKNDMVWFKKIVEIYGNDDLKKIFNDFIKNIVHIKFTHDLPDYTDEKPILYKSPSDIIKKLLNMIKEGDKLRYFYIYFEFKIVYFGRGISNIFDAINLLEKRQVELYTRRDFWFDYEVPFREGTYSYERVLEFMRYNGFLVDEKREIPEITITAGVKRDGKKYVPNTQAFTDLDKAKNFIKHGSSSGKYSVEGVEFSDKTAALEELQKY